MTWNSLRIKFSNYVEHMQWKIWRVPLLRGIWINILKIRLAVSKSVTRYLSDDTVYWVNPDKIVLAMNSGGFYNSVPAHEEKVDDDARLYQYAGIGGHYQRLERQLEVDSARFRGRVVDGDWDLQNRKFNELDFFRSYEERTLKGTKWEELPYYRRVLWQIENGDNKWGCQNKQDLDERCRKLDSIFYDMKQNGYKSREMQRKELRKGERLKEDDEISVNIGRHGELIFNNGRHRLALAKIARIKEVPVTITIRHSEWEEFKTKVESYIKKNGAQLYAPLTHIDLQNIPVYFSHEKFTEINRNIGYNNASLLDIGAGWGYYCHKFEENGFICTAVESDPENLYFLEKLKRAENRNFSVITEPISTLVKSENLKYDIVLALDLIHYLVTGELPYDKFIKLLNTLDTNELYIEPYNHEINMISDITTFSSFDSFTSYIIESSCLENITMLGEYEEGKKLYRLYR